MNSTILCEDLALRRSTLRPSFAGTGGDWELRLLDCVKRVVAEVDARVDHLVGIREPQFVRLERYVVGTIGEAPKRCKTCCTLRYRP